MRQTNAEWAEPKKLLHHNFLEQWAKLLELFDEVKSFLSLFYQIFGHSIEKAS